VRRPPTWILAGSAGGLVLTALLGAPAAAREPPALVALVLDTSGSIPRSELAHMRELVLGVLKSLPAGSEVAVFSFADQARLVQPRTSEAEAVRRAVDGLRISGQYTALYDALYDASRYLRDAGGARRAILLITDGKDENSALNLEDGLKLAQDTRIPVFCVGVGRVEERILRRIGKLTGGDYLAAREATGPDLARRVLGAPEAEGDPAPLPAARPGPPVLPAASPAPRAAIRPFPLLWAGLGITLAVLVAAAAARVRRRPPPARCPSCGSALPTPYAVCARCAPSAPTLLDPAPASALSSTVLARMNTTEEYLEKTVTLRQKPVLAVTRGSGVGKVFALARETTTSLGRARANDIVLEDVAVSSQHCRIRLEQGRFVLHDLKSTNGTLVNDQNVSRHTLSEGDVIRIGETSLQFRLESRRD
jgi:uncharacterized protein YegL